MTPRTIAAAALSLLLLPAACLAQSRPADESPDNNVTRLIRDVGNGPTNQMATMMFAAGVRNCATRVDQVGNFLTKNTRSSALLFLPDNSKWPLQMIVYTYTLLGNLTPGTGITRTGEL